MLTVAARAAVVESELESGALLCPGCGSGLAPWGYARVRSIRGRDGSSRRVRPRRSRCSRCRVTHVLLPVFCLLRRAYSVAMIGAALAAKARGAGHRSIAVLVGAPASTVRGWLRRLGGRAEQVRVFLLGLAIATGVDVAPPGPAGSCVADAVAAVGVLFAATVQRFAGSGLLGAVTGWEVASAATHARLLSPGWPPASAG